MEEIVSPETIEETAATARTLLERLENWLAGDVLTLGVALEAALLLLIAAVSWYATRAFAPWVIELSQRGTLASWVRLRVRKLAELVGPFVALVLVWAALAGLSAAGQPSGLVRVAGSLITAWVVIRLAASLIRDSSLTRLLAAIVWTVAALAIVGWLQPFLAVLDAAAFSIGDLRLSVLGLIYGLALLGFLLWASAALARLIESQIGRIDGVTPAARVLVGKVLRISFITVAMLVALTSVGIDFTAVAVFSGAVGVGIGFGLQKVVSNLISGIILLLDRSIKPGDVIEVGDAYGWIEKLGARYVAIVTRDGKEYLIPNEDLITQQVINWSYSDRAVRLKIGVGVSYQSDIRKALDLMMQAATESSRVLEQPPPATRVMAFGDSSVDLELRIWVTDPEHGVVNVASDIRLRIWDLFHQNDIKFPFPQRDLHIVSAEGLEKVLAAQSIKSGAGVAD